MNIPKYVLSVIERLEKHGYSAYLVGGCVRDIQLGLRPKDYDVASSAPPEEVLRIFASSRPTGKEQGTVTVTVRGMDVEVTTFRAEGGYSAHRRPLELSFISDIKADLSRRDFTVNAMAMSLGGELIDPFGGLADISASLLRCVGNPEQRFEEDALRMLRCFRFVAEKGFHIERNTLSALVRLAPTVEYISAERVRDELLRILLSDNPDVLEQLISYGLLSRYLVQMDITLHSLKSIAKNKLQRLCALCALLLRVSAIDSAERFMKELRFSNTEIREVAPAAEKAATHSGRLDIKAMKRVVAELGYGSAGCYAAAQIALGVTSAGRLLHCIVKSSECCRLSELAVSGADMEQLGLRGVETGKMLKMLLEAVIDEPSLNERHILLEFAENTLRNSQKTLDTYPK